MDYDRDGDGDIYVVNEYGANQLYLNDGRGHHRDDRYGVDSGRLKGVAIADLDGDLDFEVLVTNLYSDAGHRIVPLTDDRLSSRTFSELMDLIKGNTVLKRMKDGAIVISLTN